MGRLFNFLFQLVAAAVFIFLCTAAWIVFDGLSDFGGKADVALVSGRADAAQGQPRLDRVVELFKAGEFPFIIIGGSVGPSTYDQLEDMAKYLESKGIPANVILADSGGANTQVTADEAATLMKSHEFESVMLVTDYYHVSRLKLALAHAGIANIQKAHVGSLQKEDAWKICREVVALYKYIGEVYLLPEAKKVKEEAMSGADKAKADAEKAKEKVDKGLESLPK